LLIETWPGIGEVRRYALYSLVFLVLVCGAK
jgi:hypothetical protein